MMRVPVMLTWSSLLPRVRACGKRLAKGSQAYLGSWPRNGLAVANHSAIPVPMMNAASIRPASRNILVCSSFISSGWRAADSRYLLPMMPMPMQAPMAPRPMIRPAASATKLMTCSMVEMLLRTLVAEKGKGKRGKRSVRVVRLAQVHQRQHHEDEGLQRDDDQVEGGPEEARHDVADGQA